MSTEPFTPVWSREAHVSVVLGAAVMWGSVLFHVIAIVSFLFLVPLLTTWLAPSVRLEPVQVNKHEPVEMAVIEIPPPPSEPPKPVPTKEVSVSASGHEAPVAKVRLRKKSSGKGERARAVELAKHAGILGMLASSNEGSMASVFGSSESFGTLDTADAFGGLTGSSIGEAYGTGGLGLAGTGRGGGGTGEGTIGLGSLGTIGHGSGGGGAGYGRGAGRVSSRRTPRVRLARVTATGLDREIARRVLRHHRRAVAACLRDVDEGAGRLALRLELASNGTVAGARVTRSLARVADACVERALSRVRFPQPTGSSASVTVSYVR